MLLESDAAVLDLHVDGHRVAFNRAFDVSWLPDCRPGSRANCLTCPVGVLATQCLCGRGQGRIWSQTLECPSHTLQPCLPCGSTAVMLPHDRPCPRSHEDLNLCNSSVYMSQNPWLIIMLQQFNLCQYDDMEL